MVGLSRQTIATTEEPTPMHPSRSVLSQQQRIRHYAQASDAFCFFKQLTSPELFDALEAALPEHRERLFPPTETLSMFMAQAIVKCHSGLSPIVLPSFYYCLLSASSGTSGTAFR